MRGRTYSTPFSRHGLCLWRNPGFFKIPNFSHIWTNPGYSKSQIFPTFGQIPVIQNPKFFPHLDKSRLFKIPNFSHIWTNHGFSKSHVFPKTRTFHKYMLKLLLHFTRYSFSRHCLTLRVTRCLWKTIENILRGG